MPCRSFWLMRWQPSYIFWPCVVSYLLYSLLPGWVTPWWRIVELLLIVLVNWEMCNKQRLCLLHSFAANRLQSAYMVEDKQHKYLVLHCGWSLLFTEGTVIYIKLNTTNLVCMTLWTVFDMFVSSFFIYSFIHLLLFINVLFIIYFILHMERCTFYLIFVKVCMVTVSSCPHF